MDVSIIIVSWNTRNLLKICLDAVFAYPPAGEFDVWVVDNGSSDGTLAMLRQDFPQVKLIENQANIGFARANNQAIQQSSGRYVLLLNPDTEVNPDALQQLVQFLNDHPPVGAVGPRTLNPDGSLQPSAYPAPTLAREFWRLFHLDVIRPYGVYRQAGWDVRTPRRVDSLLGACLLIRRQALLQVGTLLDEQYFMYSEEIDLCYRLACAGWLLYWLPQAQIVHFGGQSTRLVAAEMFLRLYQGKLLYFRKHYGKFGAILYKLILLLAAVSRLLVSPLAWAKAPPARRRHLELAGRYWQLVKSLPAM